MNTLKVTYSQGLCFNALVADKYIPALTIGINSESAVDLLKKFVVLSSGAFDMTEYFECENYTVSVKFVTTVRGGVRQQRLAVGAFQHFDDQTKRLHPVYFDSYDGNVTFTEGLIAAVEEIEEHMIFDEFQPEFPFSYFDGSLFINSRGITAEVCLSNSDVIYFMQGLKGISNKFLTRTAMSNSDYREYLAELNYTRLIETRDCEIWGVFSDDDPDLLLLSIVYPQMDVCNLEVPIDRKELGI